MTQKKKYKYKKSFRTRKKKSILKNKFFWISVLILLVLGACFYFLLFSSFFQIKEINVSGNKKVPSENIKELVSEESNKKIFFLDSRNIFLINLKETSRKLLEKFPKIDQVNLKRKFPATIEVEIKERVAKGIWCQTETCFRLDKKGIIFEGAVVAEGELIIRSENEKTDIFLGKEIVKESSVEAILEIQKSLSEQIEIKEFIISLDEKKLTIKVEEGWEAYFNLEESVSEQVFNLDLVLKEKIPPEERRNLEYIDLRFGNRVYFKHKDESAEGESVDIVDED